MKTTFSMLLRHLVCLLALVVALACATPALALNTLLDYTSFPPVVSEPTMPNVLVMISNDHTGFYRGYNDLNAYNNKIDYWGYFDPRKYYSYKSGTFNPEGWTAADHYAPAGGTEWSGNFLNWITMTHADFLRKAFTGGKRATDATADGATTLIRADVPNDGHNWKKTYAGADLGKLVPSTYANTTNSFNNVGEVFDVFNKNNQSVTSNKPFTVKVSVCYSAMPEEGCMQYPNGNWKPAGLLQRYREKMRFGLMSYSQSNVDRGGVLRTKMKDISDLINWNSNGSEVSSSDSMIQFINNYNEKGWDPLAEMLYDGIRYIRGNEAGQAGYCNGGLQIDDSFAVYGCKSNKPWDDPVLTWCQKNNIIIINDEYPSRDGNEVPNNAFTNYSDTPAFGSGTPYNPDLRAIANLIGVNEGVNGTKQTFADYKGNTGAVSCTSKILPGLGEIRGICPAEATSEGTFYLAALAYDAFTNDMRADLEKAQNIRTYTIAFRASPGGYQIPKPPLNQMWLAGKYGNFDDKNGNGVPDLPEEWMKNADGCGTVNDVTDYDCLPKGFFYAEGGRAIEEALVEVFESILRRAASGTAVSVLATSGQGEGNLVQAYYRPAITEGTRDIKWTGYLQSLWVDKYGYIREDTNGNLKLDENIDNVIKYFLDTDGVTRVRLYPVAADPYPDFATSSFSVIEMGGVKVVWEGGQRLADMAAADRKIFTYIDMNKNEAVDTGEKLDFTVANAANIMPYLAQQTAATTEDLGKTELVRGQNLIAYIRGNDPILDSAAFTGADTLVVRDRVLGGKVWKLGDIIQSTPVALATPPDRFDIIYSDSSYQPYFNKYKDRETVVYAGANDGMLHAFTSWRYDSAASAFVRPDAAPGSEAIGTELWAYIPQNLLPHLKWLARRDYTHVNYMDLPSRIFDARIFANDLVHPNGWGTILVAGMNMGGGMTTVTGAFDNGSGTLVNETRAFKPSYVCMDITDPRNPVLLWERSYDELGFSRSIPTVIRIGKSKADGADGVWNSQINAGDWFLIFGSGPDAGETSGIPRYKGESDINAHVYVVDMKTGKPYTTTVKDWLFTTAEDNAFMNTPSSYDKNLNYNVDATYFGTTYDSNNTGLGAAPNVWKGSVYRVLTVTADLAVGTSEYKVTYSADPTQWTMMRLYDVPRPITAPGVLSIDHLGNTWAYFGTGRYMSKGIDSDEVSADQEYLFGIKDPFFNKSYLIPTVGAPGYPGKYKNSSSVYTLTNTALVDSTPFQILEFGQVLWGVAPTFGNPPWLPNTPFTADPTAANVWFWDNLVKYAQSKDGWYRKLPVGVTAERSLNRPAVLGGLALFSTFSPKGDVCDYGGNSSLWALYYETGTAYKRPTFNGSLAWKSYTLTDKDSATNRVVNEKYNLGSGTTSSVGVHIGRQNDRAEDGVSGDLATGFVQQGTGTVVDFEFETALKIRSGLRSWMER